MHQKAPPGAAGHETLVKQVDELTALYRLTDKLYRARSLDDVFDAALDAILSTLGCSRASVLLFDEAGVMRFVAWRGLSDTYRHTLEGHSPWKPGEPDPLPIFVSDIEDTEEPEWIKSTIKMEGIRGLAFIPLMAQGGVVGKFMTYYQTPHDFADHETELAVAIARQVGFSLERMRAEQARRFAEEEMRQSEERFRLMSEHAPVMIWTSDIEGRCLHLNSMLREFWNVDAASIADFDWQSTIHPEDAPDIRSRIREALDKKCSVAMKGRYRNSCGEYRILQTDAQPYFSARGEFRGMTGVNVDITEREQAEKALRDSEERFRLAVEAAPSGMVMTDGEGRILLVNTHAEKLFGYSRDELVGEPIEILVPERLRSSTQAEFRSDLNGGPTARPIGAGETIVALRKDGTEVPVEVGLSPIETSDGLMTLAAVVDISERKRADSQRDLLLAELNHRVKNTLAVVQGIAHQTFKGDEASAGARTAFEGRLVALAAAHNLLTQASWENASLLQLAVDALQVQGAHARRIFLKGPRVLLQPKAALAIAMGLHELCTNAVKYGALSNDVGEISVEWTRADGPQPRLKLVWREQGGPAVLPPKRRGFGSRLVERALAQDLDGEVSIEFRPDGLVCSIDAPLA
ncbi:PAS domain S-box protein [Pseudaminobacter sp. NGMCC 1.201702]|uniref:PAS domain S-box protein n=1 Tax=Pseudaminobacter sp. NGMCC 1.201702 TaxID=3391825 RepID=UPI0039EE41D9